MSINHIPDNNPTPIPNNQTPNNQTPTPNWDADVTYQKGDKVLFNNTIYTATRSTTNQCPTKSYYSRTEGRPWVLSPQCIPKEPTNPSTTLHTPQTPTASSQTPTTPTPSTLAQIEQAIQQTAQKQQGAKIISTIQALDNQWDASLEIINYQAKRTKAKYDALLVQGFSETQALFLCHTTWEG